jgi:hypothetical protein
VEEEEATNAGLRRVTTCPSAQDLLVSTDQTVPSPGNSHSAKARAAYLGLSHQLLGGDGGDVSAEPVEDG